MSQKMVVLKILVLTSVILLIDCESDYCQLQDDPKACKGKHHIACKGPPTTWRPMNESVECINKTIIELSPLLQTLILNEHNNWRNLLAEGAIHGFPPATHMMKMHWDPELANVSKVHVNHCFFEHDACRATEKYRKSGQNIALKLYSRPYDNRETMLREMCAQWFEEYKLLPRDQIRNIINQYQHKDEWGHFALMAREKNEAVGCALVSMKNLKLKPEVPYHYMLTCNYAETNFLRDTLYDHGDACSDCKVYGLDFKCDRAIYHRLCDNITEVTVNGTKDIGECHCSQGMNVAQVSTVTLMSLVILVGRLHF